MRVEESIYLPSHTLKGFMGASSITGAVMAAMNEIKSLREMKRTTLWQQIETAIIIGCGRILSASLYIGCRCRQHQKPNAYISSAVSASA